VTALRKDRLALAAGVVTTTLLVLLSACTKPVTEPNPSTLTAGPTSAPASASAPASTGSTASSSPSSKKLQIEVLARGLEVPWGIVPLTDGSLLVSERESGKIVRVQGGNATELRTIKEAEPAGEGGLLGLAISKDQRTVFAYFTAAEDNRIVAMSWDGQQLGEPQMIFSGIPKGGRHDGGRLALGPDGYLYVSTGETGSTPQLAQDKKSLGGKILRITTDGKPAPGNPFDNAVYSYGHRNVEGLAFDDQGRLWASEFGDTTWDELNLITKGGNYGWPLVEGSSSNEDLINPKVVWHTSDASPSGLAFWQGELWMAALRGTRLWEIPLDGTDTGKPVGHFEGDYGRLRTVVVATDGSLLLTSSNRDGRGEPKAGDDKIFRITR
jgi:glucose/arabinose dehydrogenase